MTEDGDRSRLPVAPPSARACGDCRGCCYFMAVPEVRKPEYLLCRYRAKSGCEIYGTRPDPCRAYSCLWLEGEFGDADRPDAVGLAFDLPEVIRSHPDYEGVQVICARELREGARNEPRAATLLMQLSRAMIVRLTADAGGTELMGPQRLVEQVVARARARGGA